MRPVLAIDFGDSYTAIAITVNDHGELLGSGDSRYLPSAVFVGPDGRLTVGAATEGLAEAFPERIVRRPRHLLVTGAGADIDGRAISGTALAAAVLRKALDEAAPHGGPFERTVLTYPGHWGPRELSALARAAAEAALPQPWYVPEAEAAATFYLAGDRLEPGRCVAVYNLGGHGSDITVLRRTAAGLETAAFTGGLPGGDALDAALLQLVAHRARAAGERLPDDERGRVRLHQRVTEARHRLSEHDAASVLPDGFAAPIPVTRAEFEEAITEPLGRSVDGLLSTVRDAGLTPADLAAVQLAGAAARTPKAVRDIAARLGRAPTIAGDPKAVAVLGALRSYALTARAVPAAAVPAPAPPGRPWLRPRWLALAAVPLVALVLAGSLMVRSDLRSAPAAAPSSSTPVSYAPPSSSAPSPASAEPSPSETPTEPEETPSSDGGIPEGTYSVTLSGTVSGNPFQRDAEIRVMPTVARVGTGNGVNPVEVCLKSGFPAGAPAVGAIWFGTNTACFPERGAQLDMATVSVSGDTVTIEPDSRIAATGLNNFVASGGIAACLYLPVSGSMTVTFDGDSASGEIDITGYSGPCAAVGTRASYSGKLSG